MSDTDAVSAVSFLTPRQEQSLSPAPPAYMSPEDMLKVMKGQADGWGLEGYSVPKKAATYKRPCFTFPKSKRRTFLDALATRATDPAPSQYQKDLTKGKSAPQNRPLFKAKRTTYIDQIQKAGSSSPGPGAHFLDEDRGKSTRKKGPTFPKEAGMSFLGTCEFNAREVPGAGQYFQGSPSPSPLSLKSNYYFLTPKHTPKPQTNTLGPGSYYTANYVQNPKKDTLKKDPLRSQSVRPTMNKAKRVTMIDQVAKQAKDTPSVWHYKDPTKSFQSFKSAPRDIHFYISKEKKLHRFPEQDVAVRKGVPGPGAYRTEDIERKAN